MLTALFLVWLQMSAQPQIPPIITDMVEERLHCQMGVCVEVPLDFDYTKINTTDLSPIHMILAQRAADETDGSGVHLPFCKNSHDYNCITKPPKGPLTTKHNHIEVGEFVEPVDVPAVQVTEDTSDTWWSVPSTGDADVQVKGIQRRWTCADKSRVLLTSEDGKKHCVKF